MKMCHFGVPNFTSLTLGHKERNKMFHSVLFRAAPLLLPEGLGKRLYVHECGVTGCYGYAHDGYAYFRTIIFFLFLFFLLNKHLNFGALRSTALD